MFDSRQNAMRFSTFSPCLAVRENGETQPIRCAHAVGRFPYRGTFAVNTRSITDYAYHRIVDVDSTSPRPPQVRGGTTKAEGLGDGVLLRQPMAASRTPHDVGQRPASYEVCTEQQYAPADSPIMPVATSGGMGSSPY